MTYTYENLGDERFQQLCQAILTTAFQDVQCLPVGQPDGGRDALIREMHRHPASESVVFQVKFSRNPGTKESRDVIRELIASEAHKVARLKEGGLDRYYLLTNVGGTSHSGKGSIDIVNQEFTKAFGIPAYCWWRDDLDRRIDANSSIKWSFPDIIRATDLLQALYQGKFGDDESRRLNAIRAYLSYQYKYDSQLKFKQVDLERGLIDLFVDVPAAAIGPMNPREQSKWQEQSSRSYAFAALLGEEARWHSDEDTRRIGAVEAMIDPEVITGLPRVVIEGAPGQGKSTVTQYLSQLHRIALLKKNWEWAKVPETLRPSELRLPLRVDLRDYAIWLTGRSPFADADQRSPPVTFSPALESFLAAQISAQSGGMQFSPDDLLAFAAHSSLLIVLDGFDEVADIVTRNRLVREISDASSRFEGNSISNQVIVTSRPAAFANSPGFPKDEWQYIQILPLSKPAIMEYTEKWISGHNLDSRERREIVSVLEEKLSYPHVRDLARNPMQLAILLALISTQGASLPDKRTTLYDRYIDIFFNRESEKSRIVRDKRDLLIDIHRYLAWTLQVEAESDANAGNITEQRLRDVLRVYLTELGHDPSLIDELFVGMVERVVALVSRVQGTFEFEVQPLREYFAARYLYDTAPYIQAGSARAGSIMDRLDALARNAYWLNVTRFYCGCYSSGELPSLVDGLLSLAQSEQYVGTTYVNELAVTLLGDYVFSQQPRSVKRLADFLLEPNRFRLVLARFYQERQESAVALPAGSGRERLLDAATSAFSRSRHFDTAYTAAALIKANLDQKSTLDIWFDARDALRPSDQLQFGSYLDVVEKLQCDELLRLVRRDGVGALRICVYRGRSDVFQSEPTLWRSFVELCLDGRAEWFPYHRQSEDSEMNDGERAVGLVLTLLAGLSALREDERVLGRTLLDYTRRFSPRARDSDPSVLDFASDNPELLPFSLELLEAAIHLAYQHVDPTQEFADAVSVFLQRLVEDFGHRILIVDAAVSLLRWRGGQPGPLRFAGLLSDLMDMRNFSAASQWSSRLKEAITAQNKLLVVRGYLAWIPEDFISQTASSFALLSDALTAADFQSVFVAHHNGFSPYRTEERAGLAPNFQGRVINELTPRSGALLYRLLAPGDQDRVFDAVLRSYAGDDRTLIKAKVSGAWGFATRNPEFWPDAVKIISTGYQNRVIPDHVSDRQDSVSLPLVEARNIVSDPECYPLVVIGIAERVLSERTGTQVIPVGSVAAREQWFEAG